jgi:DNA-binding response OmpR family regulator
LVVENEQALREWYCEELAAEGYEVKSVSCGKEAVDEIEAGSVHLVILDIRMPDMDGLEVLERMLGQQKKIPVIINSGYSQYRGSFMSWAADAYLVKSSKLDELKTKVRELLTRYYGAAE